MGFLEVKPEIFKTFLEKFRKDFRLFFRIFVARPMSGNTLRLVVTS